MKESLTKWFQSWFSRLRGSSGKDRNDVRSVDLIKYQLDEFMNRTKSFLRPGYSIKDLSTDMEMPTYQLSSFINHRLDMNFNDFLNRFRIRYCETLITKEGMEKYSMRELAAKCGFKNRNTFTNAFKKVTGKTPFEYIRRHL